jgi:hypothetical protein
VAFFAIDHFVLLARQKVNVKKTMLFSASSHSSREISPDAMAESTGTGRNPSDEGATIIVNRLISIRKDFAAFSGSVSPLCSPSRRPSSFKTKVATLGPVPKA